MNEVPFGKQQVLLELLFPRARMLFLNSKPRQRQTNRCKHLQQQPIRVPREDIFLIFTQVRRQYQTTSTIRLGLQSAHLLNNTGNLVSAKERRLERRLTWRAFDASHQIDQIGKTREPFLLLGTKPGQFVA